MGNPMLSYKEALENLAYYLEDDPNENLLDELEAMSIEKLEKLILKKKEETTEKEFYYNAGIVMSETLKNAYEEGTDPLNAAIGGLTDFEYFIGIREEDD